MQEEPWDLEAVIATLQLEQRPPRVADSVKEGNARASLIRDLSKVPESFFQKLVDSVLECSPADSAGISLLDKEQGKFIWPAVAGGLDAYLGGGTPMDFGPCGTVIERDACVLFARPDRHFTYLAPISPRLEEVLLVPFHVNGEAVGTVWAVIHQPDKKFDSEDKRLLESLSEFAATAYRVLTESGSLKTILGNLPVPPPQRPLTHDGGDWSFKKNR